MVVLVRILALLSGYGFGLCRAGYLYAKSKGVDIHKEGSGNVGTTNTLRVLGIKAGLITFVGDLCKAILASVVVYFLFRENYGDSIRVLELYAGFGAVLGHNFPFFMHFQGGKGIACTAGVILAVTPLEVPVCLLLFVLVVAITRYVSLGSVVVVLVFLIQSIVFGELGWLGMESASVRMEFYIVCACFAAMGIWRHRANIRRLMDGTENKIGFGSKKTDSEEK